MNQQSFYLLILSFLILQSCNTEDYVKEINFSSDLEKVSDYRFETTSDQDLSAGRYQSQEMARSGNYAVKLDSIAKKALEGTLENIQIGDEIKVQVWRSGPDKEKGKLKLSVGHLKYFSSNTPIKTDGDWELLEIDIIMAMEFPGSALRWFVTYDGTKEVYFDDISVSLKRNNGIQIQSHEKLPQVNLDISNDGLEKLEIKREKALNDGVHISEPEDWVKGRLEWNGKDKKVKVRLKGDWTDHMYGKKFSLRVNVSKGKTISNYSKFGIQKPGARYYLDEWFTHQILMDEGVLTTRYEFVDFYINNESKGLFAIEEHFTKELLKSQNRKPGVILKFSEDELWLSRYNNNKKQNNSVPWYVCSTIEAFSLDEVLENEESRKNFFIARDQMYQYQFKLGSVTTFLDIKKMAAFVALMDICNGYHALVWHNQRFYYNEESKLLEPVVYDIFQESTRNDQPDASFLGIIYVRTPGYYKVSTVDFLFQDPAFVEYYISYLEKYSNPSFFEEAKTKLQTELSLFEEEIHKEYDFYSFDLSLYKERADAIRVDLDEFKSAIDSMLIIDRKPSRYRVKVHKDYYPIKNVSLAANLNFEKQKTELQLWSFYYQELELVGFVVDGEDVSYSSPNKLPRYTKTTPPKINTFSLDFIPELVKYKVIGQDSIYSQKVKNYRLPKIRVDEEKN